MKYSANWFTKNYKARNWIFSLTKTYWTFAGTCIKRAQPKYASYYNKYCRNSRSIKCCTNANKFARTTSANSGLRKKYRKVSFQTNLQYLSCIDVLSVDGTFNSAPKFYHQLFTIHVLSNDHNVPLVFFLLADKYQTFNDDVFRYTRGI